jgi:hypothetical protein
VLRLLESAVLFIKKNMGRDAGFSQDALLCSLENSRIAGNAPGMLKYQKEKKSETGSNRNNIFEYMTPRDKFNTGTVLKQPPYFFYRQAAIFFLLVFISANTCTYSYAETVILKSGKQVNGDIIERTDKHIKIDFEGVPLVYFVDEIDRIVPEPSPELLKIEGSLDRNADIIRPEAQSPEEEVPAQEYENEVNAIVQDSMSSIMSESNSIMQGSGNKASLEGVKKKSEEAYKKLQNMKAPEGASQQHQLLADTFKLSSELMKAAMDGDQAKIAEINSKLMQLRQEITSQAATSNVPDRNSNTGNKK